MLTLRLWGGRSLTVRPSMSRSPAVSGMKPPIRLRVVVLPQPEGPSRQKNSPGRDRRSTRRRGRPPRRSAWSHGGARSRASIQARPAPGTVRLGVIAGGVRPGHRQAAGASRRVRCSRRRQPDSSRDLAQDLRTDACHADPSCATVCTMLASGPWPVNTGNRAWPPSGDDALDAARPNHRPRFGTEPHRARGHPPAPSRVRSGVAPSAPGAPGVPRAPVRPGLPFDGPPVDRRGRTHDDPPGRRRTGEPRDRGPPV